MQWMLIGKKGEIGCTLYIESGAIWPKIVGKERKERGRWQKYYKSQKKKMENSEFPAGLQ